MNDWQRVQTLFFESIELPPDQRSRFLQFSCADDPWIISEIESLIAADMNSEALIEEAVQDVAASFFDTHELIGQRLGLYRIVREIGRGGMGTVYLALRDDQEYQKEVAIKIVRRGMDTADVLKRFRYERQILASLEHPYIARLFDGGSTSDGVPFFVMEYIEGRPVDVFCREQSLDSNAICELFLLILEAVAYAHRNLVVHRDLKPVNILITAEGAPKLLDFGVAKLLSGDSGGDLTVTAAMRVFTPEYASPEQVQGLAITTSTDIYCLGVILYELLTGKRAQSIDSQTPAQIEQVVCHTEFIRPRVVTSALSSDLDNIVMMALRKDPERRYQSAGQFAEDIRRYLDGLPVRAQQDSVAYRVKKFVRRHRAQVGGGVVVAASLVVGLIISIVQTHRADIQLHIAESQRLIAQHQTMVAQTASLNELHQKALADEQRTLADAQRDRAEKQKNIAEQQRAIAEQRTGQILQLADRTLFDVHDTIAKLPGSVAARRSLVKTTLEYLESLQRESGLDDHMRATLCAAYYKIAMIQGDTQGASLADSEASQKSLIKGQALLMPAYLRHPNDPEMILRLIEIRSSMADLLYRSGQQQQGVQAYIDLLPVAHKLLNVPVCDVLCRSQEANLEGRLTYELLNIDPVRALEHANHSIALDRELLARYPGDVQITQALGSVMAGGAGAYKTLGDLEKAEEYFRESIETREELIRDDPNNSGLRRNLLVAYGNYAMLLGIPSAPNLHRPEQARVYAAKGVALARMMVSADPNDANARHDLGMILSRSGQIDPAPDSAADSLKNLEEAQSLLEPIAAANAKSVEIATQLATIFQYKAHRQESLGHRDEAVAGYRKSMALLQAFVDGHMKTAIAQYILDEQDLALLYAESKSGGQAMELSGLALTQAQNYAATIVQADARQAFLAQSWCVNALVQVRSGMTVEAQHSAAMALELWNDVANPGILSQYRDQIAEMQSISTALKSH
jgi:eukaryotic-like serine/threonine-protein kinase